jgi:uncharacterized membrane protein
MEAYAAEWLNLLLRWFHLITGIAWIGASFYFVWLDNSLEPPKDPAQKEKGVAGELWAVHGGGFYNPQKYLVAPPVLPTHLHWFKWEAYATFLSGFALLATAYYWKGQSSLLAPGSTLDTAWGPVLGLAYLLGGWLVYDLLCRSALGRNDGRLGLVVGALALGAAYSMTHVFSGRAAYLHAGAMLGSIMVANVFFVIIPGQKKLVAAMQAGQSPDPEHGRRAKQRSVHNNYFTLPVLFAMVSNHYAFLYNHALAGVVLCLVMLGGVLIRHTFNLRHKGKPGWPYFVAGSALLLVAAFIVRPEPAQAAAAGTPAADPARALAIVHARCTPCHAEKPSFAGIVAPPGGILLQTADDLDRLAERVHQQAVVLRAMPLGNLTNLTDAERAELASWFAGRGEGR